MLIKLIMKYFDKKNFFLNIILAKIVKLFMIILKELLISIKKKFLHINQNLIINLKDSIQVLLSKQETKIKIWLNKQKLWLHEITCFVLCFRRYLTLSRFGIIYFTSFLIIEITKINLN